MESVTASVTAPAALTAPAAFTAPAAPSAPAALTTPAAFTAPAAPSRSWIQTVDALPILMCNTLLKSAGNRFKAIVCRAMSLALVIAILALVAYAIRKGLDRVGGGVTTQDRAHSRVKYLVRESARLVASALEKRETNVLDAYEDAVQAAVLARTAKEVDGDVARLTKDLGVDFHEYLSYTNTVLQDMRLRLRRDG